jgi:hypothetical protein
VPFVAHHDQRRLVAALPGMPETRQPPPRFNGARYCLEANARERGDKPALIMVGPAASAAK